MKHPRCQELSNEYNTHSAQGYKRFRVIKENITLKNLFCWQFSGAQGSNSRNARDRRGVCSELFSLNMSSALPTEQRGQPLEFSEISPQINTPCPIS